MYSTVKANVASMDCPLLSVVIPCHNGEPIIVRSLRRLLGFLDEHAGDFAPVEVIVVDDGSTDRTGALVRDQFPGVRLITLARNQGKGAAVREGMLEARGRYRIFVDADLPFELSAIAEIAARLRDERVDVCMGARAENQVWPAVKRTALRRLSSFIFSGVISRLVFSKAWDTQCGLKGFEAGAAMYLFGASRIKGFAFDVEIVYLAGKNGMSMKWIPVRLVSEEYSTVSVFRHGPGMLIDTLMVPLRHRLGRYPALECRKQEVP